MGNGAHILGPIENEFGVGRHIDIIGPPFGPPVDIVGAHIGDGPLDGDRLTGERLIRNDHRRHLQVSWDRA